MQDEKNRWRLLGFLCILSLLLFARPFSPPPAPVSGASGGSLPALDQYLQDRLMGLLPPHRPLEDLVFLGIDESSLRIASEDPAVVNRVPALQLMAQPYPWSRELWAQTSQRLIDAGARLVILDLLFSNPRDGDEALRKVIEAHPDQILLVSSIEEPGKFQATGEILQYSEPVETVAWDFDFLIHNVGFANFFPGPDGIVRNAVYRTTMMELSGQRPHPDEEVFESISAVALRHLGYADEQSPPKAGLVRFPSNPTASYPALPLYEIFWPDIWEANYQGGAFFKDKVVIIGPAANQFQDIHATPAGDLLGPQLHLTAISAGAQDALFRKAASLMDAFHTLLFALFAMFVVGYLRHPLRSLAVLVGGVLFFYVLAWFALWQDHLLIGLASPLAALTLTGVGGLTADHMRSFWERAMLRRALKRRVSEEVMDEILANPHGFLNELGGVRRDLCVLFSDLRSFTSISENSAPEDILKQLNQYFDIMVDIIHSDRGMVDKFIGDAIMALWGCVPSLDRKDAAELATRSAMEMVRALPELNRDFVKSGFPPLKLGIGVHCGVAITGNLGSEKRLELTAVGDAVNLASRLEGVTKRYGVELVVSESVQAELGPAWILRPLDCVRVVGRNAPITIYEPLGLPDDPEDERALQAKLATAYAEAFELYQSGKFAQSAEHFANYLKGQPEDVPASILLERCQEFESDPPKQPWDGSVALTSK